MTARHNRHGLRLAWCLGLAAMLGLILNAAVAAQEPPTALRVILLELAETHGFVVKNIDHLGDETAQRAAGDLSRQLDTLLRGYSFIAIHGPSGDVNEVVILGRSAESGAVSVVANTVDEPSVDVRKATPGETQATDNTLSEITVAFARDDGMPVVSVLCFGSKGLQARVRLGIDLEGSAVVLPDSMIETLGLDTDALEIGSVQTFFGDFEAQLGKLTAVYLGEAGARNVDVAFVNAALLEGKGILGMRVFRGFSFSIDDFSDAIVLTMD